MTRTTVSDSQEIDAAIHLKNARLAEYITREILEGEPKAVLEAGCGKGEFTLPFLAALESWKTWIGMDIYEGPYEEDMRSLSDSLSGRFGNKQLSVHQLDLTKGIDQELPPVDLVISHEFLCDLNREGLSTVIHSLWDVLRNGGQMIHSELSPIPTNASQKLLIELDVGCSESLVPTDWFSPSEDEIVRVLRQLGADEISVGHFSDTILFKNEAASSLIERMGIDKALSEQFKDRVEKHGIEYPIEHVLSARKI